MTPNLAVIQIETPDLRMPRIWLPLFLLWIPVIVLSPLILFALYIACIAIHVSVWRSIGAFWALLCSLSGLHAHITTEDTRILLHIL